MHELPLRSLLLTAVAFAAGMPAQEAVIDPIDVIARRVQAGGDLIEMQWRRDASGRLSTCLKGDDDWQPLVADSFQLTFNSTGFVGWLMTWLHGDNDVLGMTDGERHLHRIGVATGVVELRQFVAVPVPAGADARHPEVLDRMIAIDLLRRRAARNAAPDLRGLAARDGIPAALRRRAQDALAVVEGGTRAPLPKLDAATLPLPMVADGYLIFDNARLPDTSRLADLGRRMGLASSLKVLQMLKAPRLADFRIGQTESDAIGELPYEFVRRFGNQRVGQGCVAVLWQADASPGVAFAMHLTGEFDVESMAQALPVQLPDSGFELARTDNELAGKSERGEFRVAATRFTAASTSMRGKPRPALAEKLLALGDAGLRFVVPTNSKAWLAMAALQLPPAREGELAVTFLPEFSVRATIQARDEDAAEAWVQRVQALLAQYVPEFEKQLDAGSSPPLAELVAAVKATAVAATGNVVTAELTGKSLGWATLEALLQRAAGN